MKERSVVQRPPLFARYRLGRAPRVLAVVIFLIGTIVSSLMLAPSRTVAAAEGETTDSLNLRTGPGTGYEVILVMPEGASISITGSRSNGYYPIRYQGTNGWASADYIDTDAPLGIAYTTDSLNLRSGPGTKYDVIDVMPAGASLKITGSYSKGFYPVRYQGVKGWASADYLTTDAGGSSGGGGSGSSIVGTIMRTTDRLNLRSGPGTKYGVILVMPEGADVKITGGYNKGFYPVRYNGTKGWAWADNLRTEEDWSFAVGKVYTTDWLRLRSGPSSGAGIILTMEPGTVIEVTGDYNNGYYPVDYYGTAGWASTEYLAQGSDVSPSIGKTWTSEQIIDFIYAAAKHYGVNGDDMLRVAKCESNLNPFNVTAPHFATGLFQFLPSTWATTIYAERDIFDPEVNAYAAAWMWSVGRRNEWACQ